MKYSELFPFLNMVSWLIMENWDVSLQNLCCMKKGFVIYFTWNGILQLWRIDRYSLCVYVSCSFMLLLSLNGSQNSCPSYTNNQHRIYVYVRSFRFSNKQLKIWMSLLLCIFPQSHLAVKQPVFGEVFTKTSDAVS